MTSPGKLRGVKQRRAHTPEGDKIVGVKYTVAHKHYYAVVKTKEGLHSLYSLRKLKKDGSPAKTNNLQFENLIFSTAGDACRYLWTWDMGYVQKG